MALMTIIKVPRFAQATPAPAAVATQNAEGLDAFSTETVPPAVPPPAPRRDLPPTAFPRWSQVALGAVAVVAMSAAFAAGGLWAYQRFMVTPLPATLSLVTTPDTAQVFVNDVASGSTPLSLSVPGGDYRVRLASPSGQERTFDVTLKPGESLVQRIEWAVPPPAAPTSGALQVQTEPAGLAVFIDDVRRGVSPLTVSDLAPGEHRLMVSGDSGTVRRPVTITAGETLSVVVAPQAPAVSAGWMRVVSPVLLQLRANGDLVGNTESDRVMLPSGEHQIEMSNDALGFSTERRVMVSAGRTTEVRVPIPNGTISVNAIPWAQVWIDGEALGETPLANISRPIGTHRVTFRHPEFGERQATVTVSLKAPARLGMDMRQP